MRIAHLTWSLGIGGIQTMLTGIVNEQVKEGHEVGVFVIDTIISKSLINKLDSRVKVFYMGRIPGTKPVLPFLKLNWLLWRFKPDIIHSHAGKLAKAIFTIVPMVVTVHNTRANPSDYKKYQKKFAISEAVRKDWVRQGCDELVVIDNGIPCNEIKNKQEYKFNKIIHVVQVSRIFFTLKRQDLVVLAIDKLKKHIKTDISLKGIRCVVHFVGDGDDMSNLKEMVANLKLEDDVVFEGLRDRDWVYEHLCDFDLFIQPSDYEGFGLTVAEACAAKLPVLVSNIDGPLEIIDNGRLGLTFRKGDADDLAFNLYNFVKGEYDYSMIEKAYQRVAQKYSIERTAHKYVEEYSKIIHSQND